MKVFPLVAALIFSIFTSHSQTLTFTGNVKELVSEMPVPNAAVVVRSSEGIMAFGYTDESGNYVIEIEREELVEVVLEVNSMGFKQKQKKILLSEALTFYVNFVLQEDIQSLSEVVISPDKKIEIKKDTIVYKIARFTDETERTLEDVLKNIPGIEVDGNGNIKAQGKAIQKILIEGDDLADSNYKVISRNLDPGILDKIEVISNYEENPVLKQFLSSDAVVLNLKLKDKSKSILFGTMEAGAGINNRFVADLNLGLIRPEVKILNLGNWNNSGKTATDQLSNYVFSQQNFNDYDSNFELETKPLINLEGSSNIIDEKFYVENNSLANNLLLNKTLKKNTKLRASLFFNRDNLDKNYSGLFRYFLEPEEILFTEQNELSTKNTNFRNDIDVSHSFSPKDFINFENILEFSGNNISKDLLFNASDKIDQYLENKNANLQSHLKYTRKIKKGIASLYAFLGSKNLEQDFLISPNTFAVEKAKEHSFLHVINSGRSNFQGLKSNFIFKDDRLTYSFTGQILNISEELDAQTTFVVDEEPTAVDSLSGENWSDSFQATLQLKAQYEFNKSINFGSDLRGIYNTYKNHQGSQNFLFVNPQIYFDILKTKVGSFRLAFSRDSEVPRLLFFTHNYNVQNYRQLNKGAPVVEPVSKNIYSFSYTFSRPEKRMLFNSSLSYQEFENQLIPINLLSETLNIYQYRYAAGQNFLSIYAGVTTYFDGINSSLKVGISELKFDRPTFINEEEQLIRNRSRSIYLRGTSYFRGPYNLKFSLARNENKGTIQGNQVSNIDYNLALVNILNISGRVFGNFKNEIFLVDSELFEISTAEIEYRPEGSDWVFGLRAQNIFNTHNYKFTRISEYQYAETVFRSVPRYVMLYAKIRF